MPSTVLLSKVRFKGSFRTLFQKYADRAKLVADIAEIGDDGYLTFRTAESSGLPATSGTIVSIPQSMWERAT